MFLYLTSRLLVSSFKGFRYTVLYLSIKEPDIFQWCSSFVLIAIYVFSVKYPCISWAGLLLLEPWMPKIAWLQTAGTYFWLCNEIVGNFVLICLFLGHLKCCSCLLISLSLAFSLSLHLSVSPALAAERGMVMFNACGLCCTQRRRMGSSPLISNKRSLETRQAQHRSTSFKGWSDVDTDVRPGPSTVCSWASHRLSAESQRALLLLWITCLGCQYW